jgi:membrane protein insertase, YidC/Oxa1 family, N-terminal domain
MDIQRTGLLVMLGILTYVLFLQWNTYTEDSADRAQQTQAELTTELRENSSDLEIPTTESSSSVRDVQTTQSGQTISITTPVLQLTIDLKGDDVTQALLKDYPPDIDRPNDPIALLDSRDRTYVAQSRIGRTRRP